MPCWKSNCLSSKKQEKFCCCVKNKEQADLPATLPGLSGELGGPGNAAGNNDFFRVIGAQGFEQGEPLLRVVADCASFISALQRKAYSLRRFLPRNAMRLCGSPTYLAEINFPCLISYPSRYNRANNSSRLEDMGSASRWQLCPVADIVLCNLIFLPLSRPGTMTDRPCSLLSWSLARRIS